MNGGDDDGARLIALNMALNGTPREETDRYLAENFKLTDRRGLLDEVYTRWTVNRLGAPIRLRESAQADSRQLIGRQADQPFPQTASLQARERLFGRLDSVMWTNSSSREPGSTTSRT